jgi:pyruvate dehydrogenase E1 component alpha subunit
VQAAARGAAGLRGAPNPSEVIAGLRATSHGEGLVQMLSPEGVLTPHEDFPVEVTAELLRGLYRDMVLVRRFDREGNALQRQGQLNIWVPLLGQEAAQVGAGRAMRPADMAFPSYREHGVAWCRGVDPTDLLGIFRGTDHCGWNPRETRFNSYTIVIGNQVLNAAGYAMGQKFDGVIGSRGEDAADGAGHGTADGQVGSTDEATIVFFGDGATSQGDVHEGMVFAAAFDAPIVFYCQNNQWAISEPVRKQSRVPLWERSTGYGFPGVRVDGNDVIACLAVTRWALDECRSGNGPVMVEAFTYRMDAHTTSDDPTRYRMAAEEEHWKLLDPIQRVRAHLAREGLADQAFFDEVAAEADELADRFRTFCVQMPRPAPERMFAHVYSEPHAGLQEQQREHAEYLAGFADEGAGVTGAGER